METMQQNIATMWAEGVTKKNQMKEIIIKKESFVHTQLETRLDFGKFSYIRKEQRHYFYNLSVREKYVCDRDNCSLLKKIKFSTTQYINIMFFYDFIFPLTRKLCIRFFFIFLM
jgi:hypothetical protein